MTGALTGAADATVAKKNLSDIFVLKETKNSDGKRLVAIKVKDGAQLDYEKLYNSSKRNATYPATITITDKGSNSVDVTTNITVVDVNEAPQISDCKNEYAIDENSAQEKNLARLQSSIKMLVMSLPIL